MRLTTDQFKKLTKTILMTISRIQDPILSIEGSALLVSHPKKRTIPREIIQIILVSWLLTKAKICGPQTN